MTTPKPEIIVDDVSIDFPVTSIRGVSLKTVAIATTQRIGGRVVDESASVRIVRGLDRLSFRLREGDRLGLFGPNGAGKTTLIRLLAGIHAPTSGTLTIHGRTLPMFDIALGMDDESTGYENIFIRGLVMGLSEAQIARHTDDIADFSELGPYLDMPLRTYSSGMILRLMFSIATAVEREIVLMDEWIAVGDKDFRTKAQARLEEMTRKSGILVLASHDMNMLRSVCNLGLHLARGQVQAFGPIEDVLQMASSAPERVSNEANVS